MKYICDAPDKKTWFRLETEAEVDRESELMDYAVAKHYRREREQAMVRSSIGLRNPTGPPRNWT